MSLKKKALSGLFFVTIGTYFWKIVEFAAFIVLAKILSPEDFGTVSLALVYIWFLMMFPSLGMGAALIQRKKEVDLAADTLFFMSPVIGLALSLVVFFSAPLISAFYNADITAMVRILSFSVFFSGLGTVPSSLLTRDLNFFRRVIPDIIGPIVMSVVAIVLSIKGFGAMALVWGYVCQYIVQTIVVWMLSDYRPGFRFSSRIAMELFSYGKHVVIYYASSFLIVNFATVLIGKSLGAVVLGYYILAEKFSTLIVKNFSKLINQVTFPVFSKLQDDKLVLSNNFGKLVEYSALVIFPANVGLFFISDGLLHILYGEKWVNSVPILRILVWMGLLSSFIGIASSVFFALKKHHALSIIQLFHLFLMVITFPYMSGIISVSWLIVGLFFINFVISYTVLSRILGFEILKFISSLYYIFFSTCLMGLILWFCTRNLSWDLLSLPAVVITGGVVYMASIVLLKRRLIKDSLNFIRSMLSKD